MANVAPPASDADPVVTQQQDQQAQPQETTAHTQPTPADDLNGASAVDKIKAAHAARRSRRARAVLSAAVTTESTPSVDAAVSSETDDPQIAEIKRQHEETIVALKQEATALKIEMNSLRRNHLQNIKKLSEDRDMFAAQLVKEQNKQQAKGDAKRISDIEVQLRAARTRNNDLESENSALRDELKQLSFRVQAERTLDAASDGYEKVVDDLVAVKLRCAQLEEEREDLSRTNKELTSTLSIQDEANRELEKSRSEWVVRCADLEKQRAQFEAKLKQLSAPPQAASFSHDTSYSGSDLQELKL